MSISREPIRLALLALLAPAAGFVTVGGRLRHWSEVAAADQPALFLAKGAEEAVTDSRAFGLFVKWRLKFDVYIYAKAPGTDPLSSPASVLNPLLDAVEKAMEPKIPDDKQTLGGLVTHAFISGQVETDEGLLGDQGYAIVPVEVYLSA